MGIARELAELGSAYNSGGVNQFRNRIINGSMQIDQRNAGASVTLAASGYTLDRWRAGMSLASKFSVQQNAGSVAPPEGFTNYLGMTSLSSYALAASEIFNISQRIEGFNTADLGFGTATAKAVTLSFWARSSLTGTFGGSLQNSDNSRSYPFSYTISVANTWEQKSITIAGDTSSTWVGATNGLGIQVVFSLGTGSTFSGTAGAWASADYRSATGATSVVGTNGATFYITGVQLEKGSTATSFDYRPYGTELALCQRYCVVWKSTRAYACAYIGRIGSSSSASFFAPGNFRAAPTITSSGTLLVNGTTANGVVSGFPVVDLGGNGIAFITDTNAVMTAGQGTVLLDSGSNNTSRTFNAEL